MGSLVPRFAGDWDGLFAALFVAQGIESAACYGWLVLIIL
jgi:hypothetical protein